MGVYLAAFSFVNFFLLIGKDEGWTLPGWSQEETRLGQRWRKRAWNNDLSILALIAGARQDTQDIILDT